MIPIDAIPIVRAALYPKLAAIETTYWQQAERGAALPYLVFQSQDGGGDDASMLNLGGWSGLVTVKALSLSVEAGGGGLAAAEALLSGVPTAFESLTQPSGYTIRAYLARPLTLPPLDDVHTAALIFRVDLYRT